MLQSKFDPLRPLEDVTPRFTEAQLQDLVAWFDETARPVLLVNKEEPADAITVGQLQTFLALRKFHRRTFHYPNFSEIMRELEHLQMADLKLMNKDQFIYLLDKFVLEPDMKHELKLAFKVFDLEEREFLEYEELRDIVTTYGDPLDAAETTEFLREANVRGIGNIFYNDFADDIFSLSPELYEVVPKEYLYEDADQDPSLPPLPEEIKIITVEPISIPAPIPEIDQPTVETPSPRAPEASGSKAEVAPTQPPLETTTEATETYATTDVSTPKSEATESAPETA